MRKMKDSGVEWIGEIPENWEVMKNKYILSSMYSGGTPGANNADFYTEADDGVPFVSISDMSATSYIHKTQKKLTSEGLADKNLKILPVGTILYSIYATIGAVSELKIEAAISQAMLALRLKNNINKQYYKYCLSAMREYVFGVANGNTQFNLNAEKVWNYMFPIPNMQEQEKITNYLDQKFAEIDAIIAAKEKTNELLKERRQSIIYEAVTKGLDPTVPMKDSGIEWIGEIPEHWSVIRAKYFATINNGTDPKTKGDIPVYGSGSESFKTCGEYKEGPCVLIGRKGATLHIPHFIEGKYWNVDTAFDVKTDESICLLKYYYYASTCFDYQLYISTTTLPGMTQSNYGNMFLPIPSTDEQENIVLGLEALLSDVDLLIETNNSIIEKLKEYRQSVIYEAVTGKVEI